MLVGEVLPLVVVVSVSSLGVNVVVEVVGVVEVVVLVEVTVLVEVVVVTIGGTQLQQSASDKDIL